MSARAVILASLVAATLLVVPAVIMVFRPLAPEGTARVAPLMLAMDDDGDGLLSPLEYAGRAPPELPFEIYDLDRSGQLDERELAVMILAVDPAWLVRMP
jgi:hypothetical protein